MKKYLIPVIMICISCSKVKNEIVTTVKESIEQSVDTVCFKDISVDYDSILILPPYAIVDRVETKLNINLNSIENTDIEFRDDISVFVATKNHKLVDYFAIRLYDVDFSFLKNLELYPKNKYFKIKVEEQKDFTRRRIFP